MTIGIIFSFIRFALNPLVTLSILILLFYSTITFSTEISESSPCYGKDLVFDKCYEYIDTLDEKEVQALSQKIPLSVKSSLNITEREHTERELLKSYAGLKQAKALSKKHQAYYIKSQETRKAIGEKKGIKENIYITIALLIISLPYLTLFKNSSWKLFKQITVILIPHYMNFVLIVWSLSHGGGGRIKHPIISQITDYLNPTFMMFIAPILLIFYFIIITIFKLSTIKSSIINAIAYYLTIIIFLLYGMARTGVSW